MSSRRDNNRVVNHGIVRPEDPIIVQDVIDGVRRATFSRESSTSSSSGVKVAHTMKSRWQKISTVIGISSKKPSSSMFEGCLESFDFQRILDQWIKLCSLNNAPLLEMDKIVSEIVKRSKQASSKEAKAKLDFSGCLLNNKQVQLLCRVLASNPKIVCIDIQSNPEISGVALYTVLQLQLAQVDAYRQLNSQTGGGGGERGLYLERVLYDSAPTLDPILHDMINRCSAELQVINVKGCVKRLYEKYDVERNLTSDNFYKIFHKIVGTSLTDFQACLQEGRRNIPPTRTPVLSFELLEATVIIGLKRARLISSTASIGDVDLASDYSSKISQDPVVENQSAQPDTPFNLPARSLYSTPTPYSQDQPPLPPAHDDMDLREELEEEYEEENVQQVAQPAPTTLSPHPMVSAPSPTQMEYNADVDSHGVDQDDANYELEKDVQGSRAQIGEDGNSVYDEDIMEPASFVQEDSTFQTKEDVVPDDLSNPASQFLHPVHDEQEEGVSDTSSLTHSNPSSPTLPPASKPVPLSLTNPPNRYLLYEALMDEVVGYGKEKLALQNCFGSANDQKMADELDNSRRNDGDDSSNRPESDDSVLAISDLSQTSSKPNDREGIKEDADMQGEQNEDNYEETTRQQFDNAEPDASVNAIFPLLDKKSSVHSVFTTSSAYVGYEDTYPQSMHEEVLDEEDVYAHAVCFGDVFMHEKREDAGNGESFHAELGANVEDADIGHSNDDQEVEVRHENDVDESSDYSEDDDSIGDQDEQDVENDDHTFTSHQSSLNKASGILSNLLSKQMYDDDNNAQDSNYNKTSTYDKYDMFNSNNAWKIDIHQSSKVATTIVLLAKEHEEETAVLDRAEEAIKRSQDNYNYACIQTAYNDVMGSQRAQSSDIHERSLPLTHQDRHQEDLSSATLPSDERKSQGGEDEQDGVPPPVASSDQNIDRLYAYSHSISIVQDALPSFVSALSPPLAMKNQHRNYSNPASYVGAALSQDKLLFDVSCLYMTESDILRKYYPTFNILTLLSVSTANFAFNGIVGIDKLQLCERFANLTCLNLSNNYIKGVVNGQHLPARLTQLDLSSNEISHIANFHSHCSKLLSLNVSFNKLSVLELLPLQLKSLNLSHNDIASVTMLRVLAYNVHLVELDVSDNHIQPSSYNSRMLQQLVPSLRHIVIDSHNDSAVPKAQNKISKQMRLSHHSTSKKNSTEQRHEISMAALLSNAVNPHGQADAEPETPYRMSTYQLENSSSTNRSRLPLATKTASTNRSVSATRKSRPSAEKSISSEVKSATRPSASLKSKGKASAPTTPIATKVRSASRSRNQPSEQPTMLEKKLVTKSATTTPASKRKVNPARREKEAKSHQPLSGMKRSSLPPAISFSDFLKTNKEVVGIDDKPDASPSLPVNDPAERVSDYESKSTEAHNYDADGVFAYSKQQTEIGVSSAAADTSFTWSISTIEPTLDKFPVCKEDQKDNKPESAPLVNDTAQQSNVGTIIPEPALSTKSDQSIDVEAVMSWIEATQSKLSRCRILLQELVDLANISDYVNANTISSMEEEWKELGFYDEYEGFATLDIPWYINEILVDEEEVRDIVGYLQDFYSLFLQVHSILALCSDSLRFKTFPSMLRKLLDSDAGSSINARLNNVYEVRAS